MDADVADLERALEAVKARSTRALANEELYQARIKELERMNRALVLQVRLSARAKRRAMSHWRVPPRTSPPARRPLSRGRRDETCVACAATRPYARATT